MKKEKPTQQDVASLAGVSRSTVSIVLNNQTSQFPISESTKKKVVEAAKKLGYAPNLAAQMLAGKQGSVIGYYTYDRSHLPSDRSFYFYSHLLGIEEKAKKYGYNLLVFLRGKDRQPQSVFYNGINILNQADGAILMGIRPNVDDLLNLQKVKYPFVYIGRREIPGCKMNFVVSDYEAAAYELMRYLYDLGHRRFIYIQSPERYEPQIDRFAGIQSFIDHEQDVSLHEEVIGAKDPSALASHIKTQGMTALVTQDVGLAAEITAHLLKMGINIPEEVSIAALGHGSEEPISLGNLRFTCMYQKRADVGKAAVDLLIRHLQKRDASVESIRIPCEFEQGNTAVEPLKK